MILSLLRVQQWVKNLLIFSNAIFIHQYELLISYKVYISFFSFCLIASSGYIINDLLDFKKDIKHPQKKLRPIQSGQILIKNAKIISCILFILSNILASLISINFLIIINIYFFLSVIYSMFFKKYFLIDIIFISSMLFLRVYSGEHIYGISSSFYLVLISFSLFLTLLALKRMSELKTSSGQYYKSRYYNKTNIDFIFFIFFFISVLVLFYYFLLGDGVLFYDTIIVFFIITSFSAWIFYLRKKAYQGEIKNDPFIYCMKDKFSISFAFFVLFLIIFFGK